MLCLSAVVSATARLAALQTVLPCVAFSAFRTTTHQSQDVVEVMAPTYTMGLHNTDTSTRWTTSDVMCYFVSAIFPRLSPFPADLMHKHQSWNSSKSAMLRGMGGMHLHALHVCVIARSAVQPVVSSKLGCKDWTTATKACRYQLPCKLK